MHINDNTLITALHNNDNQAFAVVYNHFVRQLAYFVEQMVRSREVAEDIVAETFTRAFKKHLDFPTLEKLKAFLFITASNAALDHLKSTRRHHLAHEELSYLSKNEAEDIERSYIKAEALQAIYQEIEALPPQCSTIIRLSFVEGKSIAEIAAIMNIAYKTVQNQKTRGLELIRMALIKNKIFNSTIILMEALRMLEKI